MSGDVIGSYQQTGIKMRSFLALIAVCAAALGACTLTPSVTHESTTMTLAQIEAEGLVCRKDQPTNRLIPRTVCASEAAWAAFDERRKEETDRMIAEGRQNANFNRFAMGGSGPPR